LRILEDWGRLLGLYKKDLGFIGFFESLSIKPDKKASRQAVAPYPDPSVAA